MKNGSQTWMYEVKKMKLIDANALEAKLEEQRKLYIEMDMKGAEHLLVHDVLHHVLEAPTIDAVPVVRCKDCLWYAPFDEQEPYACEFSGMSPVDGNDFCSCGERKDNE